MKHIQHWLKLFKDSVIIRLVVIAVLLLIILTFSFMHGEWENLKWSGTIEDFPKIGTT